jgi:DNA-binding MarR family transcriptional regulator
MTEFERIRDELLAWSQPEGLTPSVLLQVTEPVRGVLRRILRSGSITFTELGTSLGLDTAQTEEIADVLVRCGFLKTSEVGPDGEAVYTIRHSKQHRPGAPVAVWDRLFGSNTKEEE